MMSYEYDEAARINAATAEMIRMRQPVPAPVARKRVGADWEMWYRALKAHDAAIYQRVIQGVEAVTLTYRIPTQAAAEYERNAVMLACDLLSIRP
jgi:hypothetical protein